MKAERYEILKDCIVLIVPDSDGWHWEIENDVWDEIQPPDKNRNNCIADFYENMKVYRDLEVEYSAELFTLADRLYSELIASQ